MKFLIFYVGLFLFVTCAVTLTIPHHKQSVLRSSKVTRQPLVVNLKKRERTAHEKKQIVSFIQKATNNIKTSSFLQAGASTENFHKVTKSVKLPLLNTMNTQVIIFLMIDTNVVSTQVKFHLEANANHSSLSLIQVHLKHPERI